MPSTPDSVSGFYVATGAVGTLAGLTTDYLAAGGAVDLTLAPDSSSWGTVYLPGAATDGGDLRASLLGRWTVAGRAVSLALERGSFLAGVPLRVGPTALVCSVDLTGGARLELTLTRVCGCTCGGAPSPVAPAGGACAGACRCAPGR
ncbi:MAG TPA: hypothetical protein VNK43_02765 [Gemmatimonadales bacterium]|nr:hypothetical protein [Gemmatimonadales bacterium]